MSGHSKFANIKHKKEKNDAAKGKIFTMIGRELAVAVKEGGPDPANNFKLAQVVAKAKANNMPNDTIERGIKKAAGDGNSVNYETATYEGYGPSGTAIIVKCLTDNKNRTAANVRNAFTKGQGSIGTQGRYSPSPMIGNARIRRIQGILIVDVTGDAYIFKMTISPNTLVRRFSASAYLFSLVNNATINTTSNKMHNTENASLATPFLVFALPSNVVSFIKPTPSSLLFFRLL